MKILTETEITLYSADGKSTKNLKVSPAKRADHIFKVRELPGESDADGHPVGGAFEILGTHDCGWTLTAPKPEPKKKAGKADPKPAA